MPSRRCCRPDRGRAPVAPGNLSGSGLRPARAWAWLCLSIAAYASTISFGALARERVELTSEGVRQALTFGPVQLVRYSVASALALLLIRATRRRLRALIRYAGATRLWLGLALPQLLASGLLYLAFTYGSPAVAGALLFSSAFFNLVIFMVETPSARARLLQRSHLFRLLACLAIYVGGIASLARANVSAYAAGAAQPDLRLTVFLGLLAGASLAVFLWQVEKTDHVPPRERATVVSLMTATLGALVTVGWILVPGGAHVPTMGSLTSPGSAGTLVAYGLGTIVATEAMFRAVAIPHSMRSAALTLEPVIVVLFAAIIFRSQFPSRLNDAAVQVAGCVLMSVGAFGATLVTQRTSTPTT